MFPGFLITIIIVLLVIGLLLWLIEQIPGIDATIKGIIRVVIIVCVIVWLLTVLLGYSSPGFHLVR